MSTLRHPTLNRSAHELALTLASAGECQNCYARPDWRRSELKSASSRTPTAIDGEP
jgi:hypothetical protein